MSDKYAREVRRNAVFGGLAYGFGKEELTRDEYAPEPAVPAAARSRPRRRAGKDFLLALCAVLAAGLLVAALFGRIRLTALNDEAVKTSTAIETLCTEQTKLLIRYEETFDLARVEEYAVDQLGMQRPRGDQIRYLDAQRPDRVTLFPENREQTLSERVFAFIDTIGACFR